MIDTATVAIDTRAILRFNIFESFLDAYFLLTLRNAFSLAIVNTKLSARWIPNHTLKLRPQSHMLFWLHPYF